MIIRIPRARDCVETTRLDGRAPGAPSFQIGEINMTERRTFIKKVSMMAIAATASTIGRQGRAQQVSNSTGTEQPKLAAPQNACDCHMHIYDAVRFPMPPSKRVPPSNATVADY